MAIVPRSIPTKTLAQNLSSSGTTLYLNNTLDWDGAQLSSSDFGTQAFAVLRNAANTQIEFIEINPATVDSTATITITKRGLGYNGGQVADTETKYSWNAFDTYVELGADTPQLLAQLVEEAGNETIAGVKTFSSIPKTTGGNPTDDTELARKAYVDATATGTTNINRIVVAGTAGETVAAGNLVYLKAADNRWWLTDADTAATVENVILGIAQGAGTAGNAVTSGVLIQGVDSNQTGLTANTKYFASNTAGALSTSAGTTEVSIGFTLSTTTILFMPRFDQGITEDIQDGLASTTALASGNKVMSQKDFQIGAEIYAADSVGTDSYAVTLSPAPAAYVNGMVIHFKAGTANTGAATLNVNSLGAITIKKYHDQDLETGDIEANQIVTVVYNSTSTKFQMIGHLAQGMKSKTIIARGDAGTGSSGNVRFGRVGGSETTLVDSSTEPYGTIVPFDGTIKNLYVRSGGTVSATSDVYVIRKNASDTAMTVTFNNEANTTKTDTTNSFSVVAGDRLTFKQTSTGAGNPIVAEMSVELDPS